MPIRTPAPPVAIHGVPFDHLTLAEAVAAILRFIGGRVPQHVVCADSGFLRRSYADAELRRFLSEASLVLCASRSVLMASRLLGNALPQRIRPEALVSCLLDSAEKQRLKVCLLGATDFALEETKRRHPALEIVSASAPWRRREPEGPGLPAPLTAMNADLLLFPTHEAESCKWIASNRQRISVPVCLGLPGDFRRSLPGLPPLLERGRSALRLLSSLLPQFWDLRFRARAPIKRTVSAPVQAEVDWRSIKLPERLDLEAVNNDVLLLDQLLADGRHCLLDMSAVRFMDSTGIGHLVRLHKRIRSTGRQLVLLAPSDATMRTLKLVNLEEFFATAPTEDTAHALIEARAKEDTAAVASSINGGAGALVWRGEVTAANAESVWSATADLVRNITPASGRFELDLSQLRFVDSSGLSVMVRTRKLALERGLLLRFSSPSVTVLETLRRAGLEEYLLG